MMSNDLRLGVGADWTFLHDEHRAVQKDLGIAEYTSSPKNSADHPAHVRP